MWKSLKSKPYYYVIAGGVLACLCMVMFFKNSSAKTTVVSEDVPIVRTTVVGLASVAPTYTYSGEVRGRYESQLAFQTSGKIIKRNVELGSVVHAGDALMQVDAKDIQQLVNMNSAQIEAAQSQLNLAESNLNRYRTLYEHKAISQVQLDQYQNAYDVAAAAVRQASAKSVQGNNQLDYSTLYADRDGVITSINAEVGQVVNAGQPLITLVQDSEREISINIPENRIEDIRQVSQVKVTFWALPNVVSEGTIREVSPMADPVSRTYKVRINLLNAPPEVRLGMTSSVVITGANQQQTNVTYIPLSAIFQTKESPAVWVVNGDVVNLRPITVGAFGNDQVQVLSGFNPGESIVIAGVHKLREGQKVQVVGGETP